VNDPEIVYDQLAELFGKVSMDDLGRTGACIALMI
jgi:hypothetical protein